MGKKEETRKKRSQRDYSMSFKMSVIVQIEKGGSDVSTSPRSLWDQGKSTVLVWLRKYGNLDWKYPKASPVSKLHKRRNTSPKD